MYLVDTSVWIDFLRGSSNKHVTLLEALLEEGEVEMDDDEPLTEEEKEEGFILTCQSHPKSHNCVVNYDAG